MPQKQKPSPETYGALQSAYDHFNVSLFGGELPQCLIVLHRLRAGQLGHYAPGRFEAKSDPQTLDEIAIDPQIFAHSERLALSTLVHEMCHLWQQHNGKPSRNGYHNKEWSLKMQQVGLMPSSTSFAGGKRTGQKISHYIIEGGVYDAAYHTWPDKGQLRWVAVAESFERKTRKQDKLAYACICSKCWGKPGLDIVCQLCGEPMVCLESHEAEQPQQDTPEQTDRSKHLELLGLTDSASADEVKKRYLELSIKLHPDRGGNAKDFATLQSAYESLKQTAA